MQNVIKYLISFVYIKISIKIYVVRYITCIGVEVPCCDPFGSLACGCDALVVHRIHVLRDCQIFVSCICSYIVFNKQF